MYVYLVVINLLMKEVLALKILQVTVPPYTVKGQPAQLECDYELGTDILYSVKWYRDDEEFYRYIPGNVPPNQAFKVEGVNVDLQQSDNKKVILNQVTLKSTGLYRCEVSAEAPTFNSAAGEGRMEVVYLPSEPPQITGNEQENNRGDYLFFNCTSGQSYPAATLSWDLDGKKVTDPELLVEYPSTQNSYGLVSTTLGLRIPSGKSVQVQCTAKIAPTWLKESEAVVGNSPITDKKEALLLVRSSAEASTLSATLLVLPFALFVGALKKSQS